MNILSVGFADSVLPILSVVQCFLNILSAGDLGIVLHELL